MIKTLAGAAIVALSAGAASAATFNFDLDADAFKVANGYEGTFDQVYAVGGDDDLNDGAAVGLDAAAAGTAGGNTDGGITVTASSTSGGGASDPFMDGRSGDIAGLGVCSAGFFGSGISQCSSGFGGATGDDNLLSPEILTLMFDKDVFLSQLVIRDKDHNLISGAGAIEINGVDYSAAAGVVQGIGGVGFGSMFSFTTGSSGHELYISTVTADVPLPAAGFLLLGGLGGLVAMKRRKKA